MERQVSSTPAPFIPRSSPREKPTTTLEIRSFYPLKLSWRSGDTGWRHWPPPPHPDFILPQSAILAPIRWNLIEEIQQAHAEEPPPAQCPGGKVYVPSRYHQQVIQWVHESLSTGHPGVHRTSQLLRHQFWWSTMRQDIQDFVRTCSMCAQTRGSRQLPKGLMEPLPVPRRPWSHISIDFLTDLPNLGGFTTVMVVIDWFSKACKLVPMKGLPTALQTADTLCSGTCHRTLCQIGGLS
ncbi:hypothetical protein QTP86_009320 [Hemibagrus guttatus]|nr:hypothetical protein QTP86_009320 [Hemibagrus guttatus]